MSVHEKYMQRTLELALRGKGSVSPNPMVGCLIVKDGKIIGEGWHRKFGEAHAEVVAVQSVRNPLDLKDATVYVSLEPCSHHGKTPPCANMLSELPIKEVVIGSTDPNPLVSGRGIEILKNAGIGVMQGILENECRELNREFHVIMEHKRPYLILKWAETADKFVARENFDSKWISNELSRKLVHKWRSECDAIMIGKNTAKYDNPELTTRSWKGNNPLRIIIDRNLTLPESLKIYTDSHPSVTFNSKKSRNSGNKEWIKVSENNFLSEVLSLLRKREIGSILVEGGSTLLQRLMEENLWDECRIFQSEIKFGNGIAAPRWPKERKEYETLLNDKLFILKNKPNG